MTNADKKSIFGDMAKAAKPEAEPILSITKNPKPEPEPKIITISYNLDDADVARMMALFSGGERCHGTYTTEGVKSDKGKLGCKGRTVKSPPTIDLWRKHLTGKQSLGVVPIDDDGNCVWAAIDIDDYTGTGAPTALLNRCRRAGLENVAICESKSGGTHLLFFIAKPIPTARVVRKLKDIAKNLGFVGAEVFPKQTKMEDDALGNWLNMPYFGKTRRCLSPDNEYLSLTDFLDFAETVKTTPAKFSGISSIVPYIDGPPCLEQIVMAGVGDGMRNEFLFQAGVYAKEVDGEDGVSGALRQVNKDFLSPPVKDSELRTVVKSLGRGDYHYKCTSEPFVSFCDKAACQLRKYGIAKNDPEEQRRGEDDIELPSNYSGIKGPAGRIFEVIDAYNRNGCLSEIRGKHIAPIKTARLQSVIEKAGRTYDKTLTPKGKVLIQPKMLTAGVANNLLEYSEGIERCRHIDLVVNAPLIMPDGSTLAPGWNDCGVYVFAGESVDVPIDEAVASLMDILSGHLFKSDGDEARAIAGLITPALRMGGFIDGMVPIEIGEAEQSQSGKTLRQQVIRAVYNELGSVVPYHGRGGVGSLDESIANALIHGKPFIVFDNWKLDFGGPFLEMILTWEEGFVACRVPHLRSVDVDVRHMVFQVSSNGMKMSEDIANRSSIVRILQRPADFKFKRYGPQGLKLYSHVKANQAYYLGCIHSILRDWIGKGSQVLKSDIGVSDTREEWAATVGYIVREYFGKEGMMGGHFEIQSRASNPTAVFLRELFIAIRKNGLMAMTASELVAEAERLGIQYPRASANTDRIFVEVGKEFGRLWKDDPDDRRLPILIDGIAVGAVRDVDNANQWRYAVVEARQDTNSF